MATATKQRRSTKQILRDAKDLLRRGWVREEWIRYDGIGSWSPGDSWGKLEDLIEKAQTQQANPSCNVCAEGAVYLACAMAGEDEQTARDLIKQLNNSVSEITEGAYTDVVDFNDDEDEEESGADSVNDILKVFNHAEKRV